VNRKSLRNIYYKQKKGPIQINEQARIQLIDIIEIKMGLGKWLNRMPVEFHPKTTVTINVYP